MQAPRDGARGSAARPDSRCHPDPPCRQRRWRTLPGIMSKTTTSSGLRSARAACPPTSAQPELRLTGFGSRVRVTRPRGVPATGTRSDPHDAGVGADLALPWLTRLYSRWARRPRHRGRLRERTAVHPATFRASRVDGNAAGRAIMIVTWWCAPEYRPRLDPPTTRRYTANALGRATSPPPGMTRPPGDVRSASGPAGRRPMSLSRPGAATGRGRENRPVGAESEPVSRPNPDRVIRVLFRRGAGSAGQAGWQVGHQKLLRPARTSVRTSVPHTRQGRPARR